MGLSWSPPRGGEFSHRGEGDTNGRSPPLSKDRLSQGLVSAIGLLTRLPVRLESGVARPALWAFPVVGAGVGAIAAGLAAPLREFGVSPASTALLALATSALITGAMHEDGLADTADGLGGGQTVARKLEIMRDSRLGSYGALALVIVFGLRAVSLAELAEGGAWILALALVAGHGAARALAALVWAFSPEARSDGLSARLTSGQRRGGVAAVLIGVGVSFGLLGWDGLAALATAGAGAVAVAILARAHIGGVTGDVLGATEQIAEACFWTVLAGRLG